MTTMPTAVVPVSSMHIVSQGNSHRMLPARPMRCWELASFEVETTYEAGAKELVQVTVEHLPGRQMYTWMIRPVTEGLGITRLDDLTPVGPVNVWFVFDPENDCQPIGALGKDHEFFPHCSDRESANAYWEKWRRGICR